MEQLELFEEFKTTDEYSINLNGLSISSSPHLTRTDRINEVKTLVAHGCLVVISTSGGKDSQAMLIELLKYVPKKQILLIHAHLPMVEWDGVIKHIERYNHGLDLKVVQAKKTFIDMVLKRGMWPSAAFRTCTSDLKTSVINKAIRHHIKEHSLNGIVVNCMGIRAQESSNRAKKVAFQHIPQHSKAGRQWFNFYPIFDMSQDEVFATIRAAGEEPHFAYKRGMTRLSCCMCILSSKADLTLGAKLNSDTYARYVAIEKVIDHTFVQPARRKGMLIRRFLEEITGITVDTEIVDKYIEMYRDVRVKYIEENQAKKKVIT
ncbi:MAG: phosphoadenosine phosphosulfate reductase family protein [Lentisphaeraceae bacterium]|nr:phosphoadenosine phosphosulfate reductase family protein [Lentisphaeraceae bacterium]